MRELRILVCRFARFRNLHHEGWFYLSVVMFVVSVLMRLFFGERNLFLSMAGAHLMVSFGVAYVVLVKKKTSEAYSVDCIWFNGLMGAVHFLCYFI